MKTTLKTTVLSLCLFGFLSCNGNSKKTPTSDTALAEIPIHIANKQFIKVALLLDTGNSTDDLIDQAKAQIWEIVNELSCAKCDDAKPNLQIEHYEYSNDNLVGDESFIRQVLPFSSDFY